jgi:hypothetical protein
MCPPSVDGEEHNGRVVLCDQLYARRIVRLPSIDRTLAALVSPSPTFVQRYQLKPSIHDAAAMESYDHPSQNAIIEAGLSGPTLRAWRLLSFRTRGNPDACFARQNKRSRHRQPIFHLCKSSDIVDGTRAQSINAEIKRITRRPPRSTCQILGPTPLGGRHRLHTTRKTREHPRQPGSNCSFHLRCAVAIPCAVQAATG